MSLPLKLVAQQAMDNYYQQFKNDNTDFFSLEDFIQYCGNSVAAIYNTFYLEQYKEIRGDKKDEVVTFDIGWLDEMMLDVKETDGRLFSKFSKSIFTFPFDRSNTGLQNVFIVNPNDRCECERSNINNIWQLEYIPQTNKIFFYVDKGGLGFVNKGMCNVKKVRVLYVPSVYADMNVPDGIIEMVVQKTVLSMRQMADKHIVKKSLDGNDNQIIESEINKLSLK